MQPDNLFNLRGLRAEAPGALADALGLTLLLGIIALFAIGFSPDLGAV